MMLWFVMVLMTSAAILAVLWPLARRTPLRSGSDIAVYRDQLDEIERDRATGLIGEREAEAARIEVSRRLLAAADTVAPASPPDGMTGRWRRGADYPRNKARSRSWSRGSKRIWSKIRRMAAAGRCSDRSICGSGAMTTR